MELAESSESADAILGDQNDPHSGSNRQVLRRLQYLDFFFIPSYVAFFIASAWHLPEIQRSLIFVLAAVTGMLDYFEDFAILALIKSRNVRPVSFGAPKWFFYFVTLALQAFVVLRWVDRLGQRWWGWITGIVLVGAALMGIIATLKRNFQGIRSATALSFAGLIGLAFYPAVGTLSFPPALAASYLFLERIPLLGATALVALAWVGKRPGLLDVTPLGMFAVSLAVTGFGEAIAVTSRLIFVHASQRFPGLDPLTLAAPQLLMAHNQAAITLTVTVPILLATLIFSARLGRSLAQLAAGMIAGAAIVIEGCHLLRAYAAHIATGIFQGGLDRRLMDLLSSYPRLFAGYAFNQNAFMPNSSIIDDHLAAVAAVVFTVGAYVVLGIYGRGKLGKAHTVPALCSAVMILMLLCWSLAGLTFFFDAYRIPLLLILACAAFLTAQSPLADHYYELTQDRVSQAPFPDEAISASQADRVIVVAANGGGIQAAAWAAQVLAGLSADAPRFHQALRMISSVSGGSVGAAMFIDGLANGNVAGAPAHAAESSLDEVAWGLAWPDFLKNFLPWVFGRVFRIGRGRALEIAWNRNAGRHSRMDQTLSSWNQRVLEGTLPAIAMNATVTETGERLLLATTRFAGGPVAGRARLDAADLHGDLDVAITTAARLSASFPYVTPASRATIDGPQPHMVDGGYYDNYGMATLVEWLDEALRASKRIKSVLVLQVHGAPVNEDPRERRYSGSRGWFYQAYAPIDALLNVRSAGQVSHNDVELALLQQDWARKQLPVHSLTFEFPDSKAPLSWHLTAKQKRAIKQVWNSDSTVQMHRNSVLKFLEGADMLEGCGCLHCREAPRGSSTADAMMSH
jgi:hypothetical protein